jgi:hypothetical protein
MDKFLQLVFIIASLLFFAFIIKMIRKNALNLKYSLVWIASSACFIILSIFPQVLNWLSQILHIKEPVNSLFLIINFFVLLNLFTLTIAFSKSIVRIKTLTQELGISNLKLKELEEKIKE